MAKMKWVSVSSGQKRYCSDLAGVSAEAMGEVKPCHVRALMDTGQRIKVPRIVEIDYRFEFFITWGRVKMLV